jgi:hypothetical protein
VDKLQVTSMSVRYRPMRLKDVPQCANLVAGHAISGPRYGNAIPDLAPAWRRLLCCNGFCSTAVFEEVGGAAPRILGIGISVFITDRFLRELKTPPYFWIGPELAKRVAQGDHSPLLSNKQIKEANSRGGLNLAVWQGCVRVEDMRLSEVYKEVMTAFLTEHRGFLVKELVAHGETPEHLEGMRNSGGFLLKPDGCYGDFEGKSSHDIVSRPHVIGITRDMALKTTRFVGWFSFYVSTAAARLERERTAIAAFGARRWNGRGAERRSGCLALYGQEDLALGLRSRGCVPA